MRAFYVRIPLLRKCDENIVEKCNETCGQKVASAILKVKVPALLNKVYNCVCVRIMYVDTKYLISLELG